MIWLAYLIMLVPNLVVWYLSSSTTAWRVRRVITPTGRVALQLVRFHYFPDVARPVPYLGPPEP